jgi:hypothetical protein
MLPKRRPDLVTREIDGELVILDRVSGKIHQLNATASRVWSECDGSQSPLQIAGRVAETFEDAPPSVLDDVRTVLAEFHRLGLLTTAP